jgi:hypothetical protein
MLGSKLLFILHMVIVTATDVRKHHQVKVICTQNTRLGGLKVFWVRNNLIGAIEASIQINGL